MPKVAILGAGAMGSGLANALVEAGWDVNLWGTWLDDHLIDAIGLPITGCKEEEISALGAAVIAMASTGVFGDTSIATAAQKMAQFTDKSEPNMDEHEVYAELGEIQGRLYSNLKETNDLLHEFAKRHPDAELSGAEE